MRSIRASFVAATKASPVHSSYICFVRAIIGRQYSKRAISHAFKRLVDKDDYDPSERHSIIRDLYCLTLTGRKSFQHGYTKIHAKSANKIGRIQRVASVSLRPSEGKKPVKTSTPQAISRQTTYAKSEKLTKKTATPSYAV